MKKLYGIIAIIIMLSLLLSGCNGSSEVTGRNTDADTSNTDTEPIADTSASIYGTLTDDYYINEWLGLFVDLSESDMKVSIQPGTIAALGAASDCIGENAVLDMSVKKYVNDDNFSVQIIISDTKEKVLEECFSEAVNTEKNRYKDNNTANFDTKGSIDLYGEQYMQLHVTTASTTTSINGITYNTVPENFWCLFRIKEDKLITIKCISGYNGHTLDSNTLDDILNCFRSIDEVENIDDYIVEKPNCSNEQLGKMILNTLSEEKVGVGYSLTYDKAIYRLFKDYTWTFKPLSGYDYLYVATFTGTYYGHPGSYYDLRKDELEYGSLSLLVDIKGKDEVKKSDRVCAYYDNNDDTQDIIHDIWTILIDSPK